VRRDDLEDHDPWCDAHHFRHWEHGGTTSTTNGLLLCRRHHTFLHRHLDWTFTFDHQQFRVCRPDGTEVHADAWATMEWAV
jgi:predicted restriction endonuclease